MNDRKLLDDITQALQTMKNYFGEEVFDNPSRFMAGINDIVARDAKTVKHLLRIAICDLHAFTRLKKAHDEGNNFIVKHIEKEMCEDYMVPPDVSFEVVNCVAVFVGFKPSAAPSASPQETPKPETLNAKPLPIQIPAMKFPPPAMIFPETRHSQIYTSEAAAFDPSPRAGNIIRFGRYDWRILETRGNKALILSDKIIEEKWYHERETSIDWAGCSLRRYLNGAFLNTFSQEEKSRIAKTKVENSRNPWFGTDGGNDTTDMVFLLSIAEVARYFGDGRRLQKKSKHTGHIDDRYNKDRTAKTIAGSEAWWWLRSPGYSRSRTAFVSPTGALYIYGGLVFGGSGRGGGVRPVMWLSI